MQAKSHLALVTPTGKKRAVAPGRRPNAAYRKREHLTETEIEKLIEAAKSNRYGHRDATMILVAYRHGLRASEICELTWDAIDFHAATIHISARNTANRQRIRFAVTQKEQEPKSAFVFTSERGGAPLSRDSFNWMVKPVGKKVGMPFQVHAHMIRHATGYNATDVAC